MGVGRSGLRESPSQLTFPRWPLGIQPRQRPLPQLPGKENLKDILGRPVGEGSHQLKTKWIFRAGQARLSGSHLDDRRDQEEVKSLSLLENFLEELETPLPVLLWSHNWGRSRMYQEGRKRPQNQRVLNYKWQLFRGRGEDDRTAEGTRSQSHQDTGHGDRSVKR